LPTRPVVLTVLNRLIACGDREKVARDLKAPYSLVLHVAASSGWPSVDRMAARREVLRTGGSIRPTTRAALVRDVRSVSPLEDLVRVAAGSDRLATRRALRQLLAAAAQLRIAVAAEAPPGRLPGSASA
jgi:hypothetical protein